MTASRIITGRQGRGRHGAGRQTSASRCPQLLLSYATLRLRQGHPCLISRPSDALASHGPTGRPRRGLGLDTAQRHIGTVPSRTHAVVRAHPPRTYSSHLANRCRPRPTDCPTEWGVDGAHRRTLFQATARRRVAPVSHRAAAPHAPCSRRRAPPRRGATWLGRHGSAAVQRCSH